MSEELPRSCLAAKNSEKSPTPSTIMAYQITLPLDKSSVPVIYLASSEHKNKTA